MGTNLLVEADDVGLENVKLGSVGLHEQAWKLSTK